MTDFSLAHPGAVGFLGEKIETTPAQYIAPDKFFPVTDMALKQPWEFNREKAMRASRMSHVIMERSRLMPGGTITYDWNPSLAFDNMTCLLGATAAVTPIAAVVTTGPVVTANGLSTFPAVGSFIPGSIMLVNVSAGGAQTIDTEPVIVYSAAAGVVVTSALAHNAAMVSGKFVMQPVQDKFAYSLLSGPALNSLSSMTIESNKGNTWSWIYPGMFAGKADWTFGKDSSKIVMTYEGEGTPLYANAGTTLTDRTAPMSTYAPNSGDEANALRPLTSIDGAVLAYGDPDRTGTSAVRRAYGVVDAKITFDGKLIKEAAMNGSTSYLVFPGDDAGLTFEYNEIDTVDRPDIYLDAILPSVASVFNVSHLKNYGAPGVYNFGGCSLWVPQARFSDQESQQKIGSIDKFNKKGEALTGGGVNDYLIIYRLKPS